MLSAIFDSNFFESKTLRNDNLDEYITLVIVI